MQQLKRRIDDSLDEIFLKSLVPTGADVDAEGPLHQRQAISQTFHGGPDGEKSHQERGQGRAFIHDP